MGKVKVWGEKGAKGHKNLHLFSAYHRQGFVLSFSWSFSFNPQNNSVR